MPTVQLFDPPSNPSFVWNVTDRFSTIETQGDRGHRLTRARRDRKLRTWQLQWVNAPQLDLDYLRGFFEFHLGAAVAFCWDLPSPRVFTPRPPFFGGSLAAGDGGSGALSDGTFDVAYAFNNANGETQESPIQQIVLSAATATQFITVTAPPRFPADCVDVRVFAEAAATLGKFQGVISSPAGTFQIDSIAAGANPSLVNAMQGQPMVNITDEPVYDLVAADVWQVTVLFRELLA